MFGQPEQGTYVAVALSCFRRGARCGPASGSPLACDSTCHGLRCATVRYTAASNSTRRSLTEIARPNADIWSVRQLFGVDGVRAGHGTMTQVCSRRRIKDTRHHASEPRFRQHVRRDNRYELLLPWLPASR